jgi:penicillin amidase
MTVSSNTTYQVLGLSAPISITIDQWGIPHITAQTIDDAFFGQGYCAALMRLWQLDVNHRRQTGTLAEVFGPAFVPFDHVARLLAFRGPIDQEWKKLDPRVEGIAEAFVAGINARVEQVLQDTKLLPIEFQTLGMLPARWDKEDLLRARVAASPNIQGEVRRAVLASRGMLEADALAHPLEPAWPLTIPKGFDPASVTRADLTLLNYRVAPLPFDQIKHVAHLDASVLAEIFQPDIDSRNGSNAWVVAPALTATGRAMLANDPHLPFSIPSPRMVSHLMAPGLNVIGAGPVWRPGVQFGHNERIAFGRTDFQIDQEDLYVLEVSADGTQYRGPNVAEPIERVTEEIKVRGQAPVIVTLAFTALGPIVSEGPSAAISGATNSAINTPTHINSNIPNTLNATQVGRAVVLRAAWLQSGASANLEYVPKVFAQNWDEFRAAIRHAVWGTNYMYADVDGNIGWQSAGRVPVRRHHDGLLPVPAAGDYPWDGILPLDQMPGEFNPTRGWIASANQMPLPPDWPVAERRISFEWTANDRHRRIVQCLSSMAAKHTQSDSWALQQDVYSSRARILIDLLHAAQSANPDPLQASVQWSFLHWSCEISAESREAALYEYWWGLLQREVRPLLVPPSISDVIAAVHPHVTLAALQQPDARFGAHPTRARDRVLLDCLFRTYRHLSKLATEKGWVTPDQELPTWGQLHDVHLSHPLEAKLPAALAAIATAKGHGSAGDGSTVYARWWPTIENMNVTGGSSFRAVVDVGNWPAGIASLGPGQEGSPGDRHYRDLYDLWLDNTPVPLAFDQQHVASVAEAVFQLVPRVR